MTQHRCPLCGYLWFALTDAPDYPYYCPGCGEQYSPYNDDEIYAGVLVGRGAAWLAWLGEVGRGMLRRGAARKQKPRPVWRPDGANGREKKINFPDYNRKGKFVNMDLEKPPPLTEETYFSPQANMAYMSASQYKSFRRCEAAALAEIKGEYVCPTTTALLVGSYVDAHFSGDLPRFRAEHPEIFKRDGSLKADYQQAESIIERMESDGLYSLLMSGQKQVILTGSIAGIPFKAKIDSLLGVFGVEEIRREFPECYDLFEFADGCICDQKVMANLDSVWDATERRRVSFIEYYGYDIQGAIYQALQGDALPFVLAVGTKQDPPDLAAIHIPDSVLSDALREVEENAPRFQKIKLGLETPTRCEKCAYCRMTRRLTKIEEYSGEDTSC